MWLTPFFDKFVAIVCFTNLCNSNEIFVFSSDADTSGLTFKGDVTNIICVDMHERDNDTGSYAIDGPEQGLALGDEKAELDEIMSSSTKYDEHDQIFPDNFEDENLTRKDTKAVGDSVLQNPIGNKHFLDFPADVFSCSISQRKFLYCINSI